MNIIISKILQLLCIICTIVSSESARILGVFPTPSISHQVVFRPLMQELAKRGHEVVVITPDPAFKKGQAPQNLTEIDVHEVSYKIWNDLLETGVNSATMEAFFKIITVIVDAQIKTKEVQKLINDKSNTFDLLFVESWVRPALSFAYLYNVPVIEFSSMGGEVRIFDECGAPQNILVYPSMGQRRIFNLSLWEKLSVLYNDYIIRNMLKELEKVDNKMVRSIFGQEIPDLHEFKKHIHMYFLNVNPIWDSNRPVPPNILYLGGIHQKPINELAKDLKSYLDSSKNGIIYMSFGTNIIPSLLPLDKLRIFTKVFSQLPYDILWKWNENEIPGQPTNVKISKWLPQSDLLMHPKVKLFITQGGLQSTDEALAAGVPLVVVPLLGDQWFNAEQCVRLNIGIHLDLQIINEDNLRNAINVIIENKTYRENVVKLRDLIRDQPQSPLERAVWWTEYVLRHGGATQLRSAAAHMHWTKYYSVDLIFLGLAVCIALFIGFVLVIRLVFMKIKIIYYNTKNKIE